MPPLPSPNDARGRYLLRIYTAALGYAVGHSYITVYGYTYERMVAGVFGIIAIALVVLALILAHARAEMEMERQTKARLMDEIYEIIDPGSVSGSLASSQVTATRTMPAPHR